MMNNIMVYEFDTLTGNSVGIKGADGAHLIPNRVYQWLEDRCLRAAEKGDAVWLRLAQRRGCRVVQVTSFVGVIRAPDGYQIEVLPKVGKAIGGGYSEARELLVEMLSCLGGFRHIQTDSAKLLARRMPLLEVFISEFLCAVEQSSSVAYAAITVNSKTTCLLCAASCRWPHTCGKTCVGVTASLPNSTNFLPTDQKTACCTRRCGAH